VPLPQDDVIVNNTATGGAAITADMPRLGRNIDFTGSSGWTWTTSTTASIFGSLNLTSLGTLTASTQTTTFAGRGSYTVTSAGFSWAKAITIGAPSGTYALADAFTTTGALTVSAGTFNTNGQTFTAASISSTAAAATLTFGASTVNLTATAAGNIFVCTSATLNAGTSNLVIASASSNTRGISCSGRTLATVTYTVASSTGKLQLSVATGTTTIGTLTVGDNRALEAFSGSTIAVTNFNVAGTASNLVTITTSTAASAATFSKAYGTVEADYLSVKDITATGGASWYAGDNSTNVSGNTGWFFRKRDTGRFLALAA
jgi:hypothetical protein